MNKRVFQVGLGVVIVLLLLVLVCRSRFPFGRNNTSFASEPEDEITKIELSSGKQRLTLEKIGEDWFINGEDETRKSGIQFIVRVLEEIKIKSTVSPELFESEVNAKGIIPVFVKVFEKRKLLKRFMVYKTGSNKYGNIMKISERSKPYIVYVPGYEGDIGSGFIVKESFWQPYTAFNLMPSEIASVYFEDFSDTASSFSIINTNNRYLISGKEDKPGLDTSLVRRYISYFAWVPFESWAFEFTQQEKKTIELQQPLYRISVGTTSGKKSVLTLWERMTISDGEKMRDSDRLLGKIQTSDDFFLMRYFDIDPLIKKSSYFFPY